MFLVLLGIGFVAGVVTAISPCVLPVLPVLLAGGASGRKPFRIIAGLITSFVLFTLFATWLLNRLGLPDDLLRNIGIALLFLIAAILLVPRLGLLLERPFAGLTRFRASGGGFLLGASLGLVFVPCAGPVLAAVTVQAARDHVGLRTFLLLTAYAVGAALPMLAVVLGGRELAGSFRAHAGQLRFASGLLIALVALAITFNLDTSLQTALPGYTSALQGLESTGTARHQLQRLDGERTLLHSPTTTTTPVASAGPGASSLPVLAKAPPIVAGGDWFNTKPLSIAGLHGKVVLLDFWTYSCINCLRTLPHLEAWWKTYHRYGLEIIGVHSPEFAFEHVSANVAAAIKRLGIRYPVVQDNNFATWTNYANEFWPADYLIDQQGRIRAYFTGEGDYGAIESDIQQLLGVSTPMTAVPDLTPTGNMTAETYLGYLRLDVTRYVGGFIAKNVSKDYPSVHRVPLNAIAYGGNWTIDDMVANAGKAATLSLHYEGKDVYLVAGGRGTVTVFRNGHETEKVPVTSDRLYTIHASGHNGQGLLTLHFTPGLQAYSFTFG
jgi:cytochrome c biogenesis protein CcdA/thiol-disulfide isomerase/thioredoxin